MPNGDWKSEAETHAINAKLLLKAHKKRVAKTQVLVNLPYMVEPLRLQQVPITNYKQILFTHFYPSLQVKKHDFYMLGTQQVLMELVGNLHF